MTAPAVAAVAPAAAPARHAVVAAPALALGSPRQVARSLAANAGWSAAANGRLSRPAVAAREQSSSPTIRNSQVWCLRHPPGAARLTDGQRRGPTGGPIQVTQVQWGLTYIGTRYATACRMPGRTGSTTAGIRPRNCPKWPAPGGAGHWHVTVAIGRRSSVWTASHREDVECLVELGSVRSPLAT